MDDESNCGNCYFWRQGFPQKRAGNCRRNPPVIVGSLIKRDEYDRDDVSDATVFPITQGHDWCGEFRHKGRMT